MNAIDAQGQRIAQFNARYRREQNIKWAWTGFYGVIFLAALAGSVWVSDFNIPDLMKGLPKAWNYIARTLPQLTLENLWADLGDWYWGLRKWLVLLVETVFMGFVGTALGGIGALLLCFAASRNLVSNTWIYFAARRALEFFRTVPELIFALIFVFAFGLGPFAGVLAIAVHTIGALGKLFAEVNENVDERPIEGVRAAGGNWPMIMRLAGRAAGAAQLCGATCCCASRSMCAAPRRSASSAPAASGRSSTSPSGSSSIPTSRPSCCCSSPSRRSSTSPAKPSAIA